MHVKIEGSLYHVYNEYAGVELSFIELSSDQVRHEINAAVMQPVDVPEVAILNSVGTN